MNNGTTPLRILLGLSLFAASCHSPALKDLEDNKSEKGNTEVVTSPQQATSVEFNVNYLWKVGSSLEVPSCGEIDLEHISKDAIRFHRDESGSVARVPDRISVGNNVIMVIKEIDPANQWLRVEFVVRRPYVM